MIVNRIGQEVIRTAINGVKEWKSSFMNLGDECSIDFKKENIKIRFFLGIDGDHVTYKIFKKEIPVTKEKNVLSTESVRDILAAYEGEKE